MKKAWYAKFILIVSAVLTIGFCIRLGADYWTYNAAANSAPFYVFILERAFEFLLPAAILLAVGLILKKKFAGSKK